MGVPSISVQNALNALPEDEEETVWDPTGRVGMPKRDHDSYVARGIDPWTQIKVTPYRKASAPLAVPLEDGESGSSLSPEPERPKFGPIPGMAPEQIDSVVKFASERATPAEAPASSEPSDEEKMRMAMEFARANAEEKEAMGGLQAAGRNIGRAISRRPADGNFEKDLSARAWRPVGQLEKDQGIERSEHAKQQEAARRFALEKLGLEDREAATKFRQDQLAETKRHNEASEKTAAADAASRAAKGRNSGGWLTKEQTKQREDASERDVPGWTRPPGAPLIKVEEASKMRDLVAAEAEMGSAMERMRVAKNDSGREFLPGPDKDAQMGGSATMLLAIKALASTGALDEQTERIARSLVPQPSDGPASSEAKLKQLRALVDGKVNGFAQARGYQRAGAPANAAGEEMVMMQAPDGQRRRVPRSKVQAAISAGGKVLSGG